MCHITYGQCSHIIYTPHIKTTDIAAHAPMFTNSRGSNCTISMVMKSRYYTPVDIVEPTPKGSFLAKKAHKSNCPILDR